ncbi:hypothetical protein [Leptolyngbya sp. 7M]|uniref:hypothetical protein n=1 Tax=Leptolyngbya sp. 7M TaxID=2812896 RepID=UPI001B8BE408|nr:hypothetical protein [Leptolyngbya sp. 7M]QYO67057.1 hypothetical protein JVX88_09750 [Leptolyngbya sp. 7M]
MNKKFYFLLFSLVISIAFAACGGSSTETPANRTNANTGAANTANAHLLLDGH